MPSSSNCSLRTLNWETPTSITFTLNTLQIRTDAQWIPVDSKVFFAFKKNITFFKAQTLISGWTFFGIKMNSQAAYLCFNNFPSLASYIKIPSPDRSGTPQWDRYESKFIFYWNHYFSISNGVRTNLDQNCMCTRMNDTNTLKIVVWLVFTVP